MGGEIKEGRSGLAGGWPGDWIAPPRSDTLAAMDPVWFAWLFLIGGYLLPLAHVALARDGGSWRAPETGTCPFSPRAGWLVMVLLLGPIGWLLFLQARRRRRGRQARGLTRPQDLKNPSAPER